MKTEKLEQAAIHVAERKLIERYPEKFSRLLREQVASKNIVTIFRTTTREVTEDEAEILEKYGWHRLSYLSRLEKEDWIS